MAGTKPSTAQSRKLFMRNHLLMWKLNRSIHVTTCDRGEAGRTRRSIQFRQTPNRIRAGRIGTASEVARYSRLTPDTCGASTAMAAGATAACPGTNPAAGPLDAASG